MAEVLIKHLVKRFGKVEAVKRRLAAGRRRRVPGPARPVRVRQEHDPARRRRASRTPTPGEIVIGGRLVNFIDPVKRNVAMVFQNYALYPHMTVHEEHRLPARDREEAEGRDRRGDSPRRRHPRARGAARAPAGAALGRAAPARRARPRDRPRAAGVPDGRAALEPRRAAPHPDAARADPAPCAARDHDHVRHARPGRGDDDGRPDRRHEATASCSRSGRRRTSTAAPPTCSSRRSSGRRR